jgi:hypothetical protein
MCADSRWPARAMDLLFQYHTRQTRSHGRMVADAPRSVAWLRFNADPIVHRSANALFVAEIAFGCLDRDVAKQELDLLQLSAGSMAQLRTRASQVVGRDGPEAELASVLLYHMPNEAFGHALTPAFASPADAME